MQEKFLPKNYVDNPGVIFETDWLASTPVFYNLNDGLASENIHDVMPPVDILSFHSEGLYNFLDFGYSVFGQTPVENVCFLPPSSRLHRDNKGQLRVEQLSDPIEQWWDFRLSENEIIELIRERVQAWEASLPSDQEIVLPLSGGFDSRLLLWCLQDKSRVRAYTYGLSDNQAYSTEVVHARTLAKRLGVRWEQVILGDFHQHFADWDRAFGIATHAHGMYHFEFYRKIKEGLKGQHALLSGLIGDAWAGSIPQRHLRASNDLIQLGYTHGLRADPEQLLISVPCRLRDQFWTDHLAHLSHHKFQVVTSMRFKLILLSYLKCIPRLFGFQPFTPFLDIDIAMAMLNLQPERRANRQWQRDFFTKVDLDLENQKLRSVPTNSLVRQAIKQCPLDPLDSALLSDLFDKDYISWINRSVLITSFGEVQFKLLTMRKISVILRLLGMRDTNLEAYGAYLCLKPIESLLHRQHDSQVSVDRKLMVP
jgi:hypothetical protein